MEEVRNITGGRVYMHMGMKKFGSLEKSAAGIFFLYYGVRAWLEEDLGSKSV